MTNEGIYNYRLWNAKGGGDGECSVHGDAQNKALMEFSTKHLNLRYRQGVGVTSPCLVDTDSDMRLNPIWTSEKTKSQLAKRFYLANPNLSKGTADPSIEDSLVHGEHTAYGKQCVRANPSDRLFPLLPCLRDQLNDVRTKIQPFKRIGEDSRQLMRDLQPDFNRCSCAVPPNRQNTNQQKCG